jgi:hypothetical protein
MIVIFKLLNTMQLYTFILKITKKKLFFLKKIRKALIFCCQACVVSRRRRVARGIVAEPPVGAALAAALRVMERIARPHKKSPNKGLFFYGGSPKLMC